VKNHRKAHRGLRRGKRGKPITNWTGWRRKLFPKGNAMSGVREATAVYDFPGETCKTEGIKVLSNISRASGQRFEQLRKRKQDFLTWWNLARGLWTAARIALHTSRATDGWSRCGNTRRPPMPATT